jgi:hypothetical protein
LTEPGDLSHRNKEGSLSRDVAGDFAYVVVVGRQSLDVFQNSIHFGLSLSLVDVILLTVAPLDMTNMPLFRSVTALWSISISILFLSSDSVDAFASKKSLTPTSRLWVAKDVTETQEQEVPYAISSGDGSTGGGGLPMPQQEDDGLMRPKVISITMCRLVFRR